MNQTQLVGRLTKELEVYKTNAGESIVSFTVAVKRTNSPKTDYLNCVAFRKVADFMGNYLNKGDLISVQGFNQSRSYEKEGTKVFVQEIVAVQVSSLETKAQKEIRKNNVTKADIELIDQVSEDIIDSEFELNITEDDLPF